jgi:hypothetical protein
MFYVVALEGCPYSQQAVQVLHHIKGLKTTIKWINSQEKSHYKTSQRSTFPQISYLVKPTSTGKNQEIYIGGLDELNYLLDTVTNLKTHGFNSQIVIPLMNLLQKM